MNSSLLKASDILHILGDHLKANRLLLLTADVCGTPTLQKVEIDRFSTALSLRYKSSSDPTHETGSSCPPFDSIVSSLQNFNPFDLVFADPYHSYEDSKRLLNLAISSTLPKGWVVIHDCYPPIELTDEKYLGGSGWSGVTFAAFRDVALKTNRAWFVIDADLGVGILGPANTSHMILDSLDQTIENAWEIAGLDEKRELYRNNGKALMRVIDENFFYEILIKLLNSN